MKKFPRGLWVSIGLAIGAGLGVIIHNIPIGAGIGLVIGAAMDLLQNRKKG